MLLGDLNFKLASLMIKYSNLNLLPACPKWDSGR